MTYDADRAALGGSADGAHPAPAPVPPTGAPSYFAGPVPAVPAGSLPVDRPPSRVVGTRPPQDDDTLTGRVKRLLAPLAGVGAFLVKFGAIIIKFKSLTVVGSLAISIAAYASLWGWQFAVGFVALLLIHELGHVVAMRARGVQVSAPLFIPFMGAFVTAKTPHRSVYEEAESALAGPLAGAVAAFAVGYAGRAHHSGLLLALGYTGLLLGLFNLLPMLPLDGGRVAGALHPALWFAGLVLLLGVEIHRPSPIIPVLLLLGGYELYHRWRGRGSAAASIYHQLRPGQRLQMGAAYVGLIVVTLIGMHAFYVARTLS